MVREKKVENELEKIKGGDIRMDNMKMIVDNLLLQSDMDQIETFLGTIWFNFAKLQEKFDDLSERCDVR